MAVRPIPAGCNTILPEVFLFKVVLFGFVDDSVINLKWTLYIIFMFQCSFLQSSCKSNVYIWKCTVSIHI